VKLVEDLPISMALMEFMVAMAYLQMAFSTRAL
jgi:hypothetical protein